MNMKTIRTSLALMLLLAATAVPAFGQAAGRIVGEVEDNEGKPVKGAKVTVTTPAKTDFNETFTTNKKGRFTIIVVDATVPYDIKIEAEGFRTLEQSVKPTPGQIERAEVTLYPVGVAAPSDPPEAQEPQVRRGSLTDAQKAYNAGVEASQVQDWDTAKAKFMEAVELDGELVEAHLAVARLHLRDQQYEAALASAEAALALKPEDAGALEIGFDVHTMLNNEEKAAEYMAKLEAVGAGELAPRYFNAGVGALNAGDQETARAKFRQAIEQDPNLTDAHSALAVVELQLENFEGALTAADAALALDPGNARALRMRFQALRFLGRDADAKAAFDSLEPADQEEALVLTYNQASKLFNAGDTAKAKALVEDILAADPEFAKAHYMMGLSYLNTGDMAKAKEHFARFLELAPDDPDAATAREMISSLG